MDIPSNYEDLSPKDQKKVANLITKLNNKVIKQESTEGKQDRSVRRPPASQIKQVSEQGTFQQKNTNRITNKSRIDQHPKVQAPIQRAHSRSIEELNGVDLKLDIDEPNRPNLFVDNGFTNLHKQDINIDKKLAGSNVVANRGQRTELINVECRICRNIYSVSHKLVQKDRDGLRFVCDRCQRVG